ncbi:MAG: PQQ-binding-like beta-propeller repeat protein [Candidatus Bathyarchaeota archaeon]|nr:PQQ-binding-like beta-propeller repeat protein [Candidatus Bathyarchaeum tardum]WGM90475.1 MAG: PQQ-binding-like beta-propeller repeat protein [Candidatus Bathyarchaeum tardum]
MIKKYLANKMITISLIVIFVFSTMSFILPTMAQATVDPNPYINAMPNPVQVNNPVLFHVGSVYPTPTSVVGWEGLMVEVVKPDGSTEMLGPITTDTTGGTGVLYTPTTLGTYTIRTLFPETVTTFNSARIGPIGTVMEETYSEPVELIVREEPLEFYPGHKLPEGYWGRPVGGELREWNVILGNHLHSSLPTGTGPHNIVKQGNEYAPETGHVLWRHQMTTGGLAGGFGNLAFEQGDAYEEKFHGTVILGGILFYNNFEDQYGPEHIELPVVAIDLKTGKQLWRSELVAYDGTIEKIAFGQLFYWDSYNYHGAFGYLWTVSGSTWHAFDPWTGRWEYTMENVPSGTNVWGPRGEIYRYNINKNQGTMTLWNSSRVVSDEGSWRPQGEVYDATDGIEWTINIPGLSDMEGSVYKVRENYIIGADFQRGGRAPTPAHIWAIEVDIMKAEAELIWDTTWTLPSGVQTVTVEDVSAEQDLIIHSSKETRQTWGRRLSTGEMIWGPTAKRHYTDNWGHSSGNSWDIIAEDKVIAGNYGGTVWCYDAQTGNVEWTFDIPDPYTEVLHNNFWRFRPAQVTDGKLYIENTEHNPRDPQPRGAPYICIDLETGTEIWRLPYRQGEWSTHSIIGDSTIVMQNTYDQAVYAVGKGPSAITLEAPLTGVTAGSSVVLRGMVTDISPGTQEELIKLRFPNGVPAVSDSDMTAWMTYVYNQYEQPADVTGVPVKIEIVDPNGHYEWIGTATTDVYGNYGYSFRPQVEGQYLIITTFEGSASYYGSTSTTYITIDPAPTPAAPIEPEEPETPVAPIEPTQPETPLITTEIAIVIAVAAVSVIGVAAYWMLRRK